MKQIDLNCDVGEGVGNENELLPLISSCSIACGGHAGDVQTMEEVIGIAMRHKVKIGAHPSYPDRENFGRKSVKMSRNAFIESIRAQLNSFCEILEKQKASLNHIKPHGALYNDLANDPVLSKVFLDAVSPFKSGVKLYVPFGSVIAEEAQKQEWELVYEAFGDRNYNNDLSLVSRNEPNALILDPEKVMGHILNIIDTGKVKTISGDIQPIRAETFCLHGDTPYVLQILMYLSRELPKRAVQVK
ncbi:5-oxoprolinase subunit PxpA [Lentiprolixibacter aurantiacus]|uniref:5-oxoprolinase subunit PxpA n=1 Tax=Lentiprolixibacter aurantiacus TaxID=2993939 RepID=A0AAE3MKW9_9FLAO|nr:5-oxoprolinase subunit PxpA [Lentiprolixibacter aurantiacus]MCX2719710.1 5-oxoprolinase subunit PxpA [Lentiprolixibacter aurantiacus]